MYTDFSDNFARDGALNDSVVDGFRTGYVPPFEFDPAGNPVPDGLLTGVARNLPVAGCLKVAAITSHRASMAARSDESPTAGPAVACLPWRVYPELGEVYLLEMSAIVAEGETVSMAYFGDVQAYGTSQGLANELGQLVLGIARGTQAAGTQDQLTWNIAWDDNGSRREFSGTSIASLNGEEIRMQLRWDDIRNSGNDLFDAWLETGSGNQQLLSGSMSTEIDVFGAGFELNGTGSMITGFLTAVPEPSSALMGMGIFGLLLVLRHRK